MTTNLQQAFPHCYKLLSNEVIQAIEKTTPSVENFPDFLRSLSNKQRAEHLPDLATIELACHQVALSPETPARHADAIVINPHLQLIRVDWQPLLHLISGMDFTPKANSQFILIWKQPHSTEVSQTAALPDDLLALKIIAEQLNPMMVAKSHNQPVGFIDKIIEKSIRKGLLLTPSSKLHRQHSGFIIPPDTPEKFLLADAFTLQWHITHRCDLNCRHCYDRSLLTDVSLEQGLTILDQMRDFCLRHHVYGQISFSGGNPFLHPHFFELYQAARDRNLSLAILGNPVSEAQLHKLLAIQKPVFYQVSLEGLQPHNDYIRGDGNFTAVFDFLEQLKSRQIYSMVMLTLTQDNMDQVLPLAELLRSRVNLFTYNRLSMVGEGANLESPHEQDYHVFVREYLQACQHNPIMAIKDNLINIERENQAQGIFGGCTGFGCGAAFNFFSLLPNGQVDACRKFPSPIGNINQQSLEEIYYSAPANAYRKGSDACISCHLRPVCGGCLAVTHGCGLNPLKDKDPGCFY